MSEHRARSIVVHNLRLQPSSDRAESVAGPDLVEGAYFLCKVCRHPHLAPRQYGRSPEEFDPGRIPHTPLACPDNGLLRLYKGEEFYWDAAPAPRPRWQR